jgi:hypothetical protein
MSELRTTAATIAIPREKLATARRRLINPPMFINFLYERAFSDAISWPVAIQRCFC